MPTFGPELSSDTIIAALGFTPADDANALHDEGDETKSGTLVLVGGYLKAAVGYGVFSDQIRPEDAGDVLLIGRAWRIVIQANNSNTILFDGGVNISTSVRSYSASYPVSIADNGGITKFGGNIVCIPQSSAIPSDNGELTFEATSDTSLTVKFKGSDGVVRSGSINLT